MTDRIAAGYTYFLTLTAPGNSPHRQWVQGKLTRPRSTCNCHDNGSTLGEWNGQESAHWNRFRTALSRMVDGSLTYVGSVEVQARGALHRHIVLNVDRALLPEEVQQLALVAGYGCVYDLQVITSASKAAWYISKYVTKSAGQRSDVPWVRDVLDQETGEVRAMKTTATYRTWSAAQSWGYTMKGLRDRMREEAQRRALYLRELEELLAEETGGLALETAGHVHMAGPPT